MFRRSGMLSLLALTSYLLCGATAPQQCKTSQNQDHLGRDIVIGGVVGAAVIATAIVVPVEITKHHHTLKGCVMAGEEGLQIQEEDAKTFTLTGVTADIKSGNLVKLHGMKQNPPKGHSDNPTFLVEKVTKDYGPCKVVPVVVGAATSIP